MQPRVVQPEPDGEGYRLLAGHCRLAAAQQAGLDAVPTIVRHGIDDGAALELMLVENCLRADLNLMEKAEAFAALINRGYTQTEVAKRTGISASTSVSSSKPRTRPMRRPPEGPTPDTLTPKGAAVIDCRPFLCPDPGPPGPPCQLFARIRRMSMMPPSWSTRR